MENNNLTENSQREAILIEAFHLMYDHYPESAMLILKDKTIMAVNPAAAAIGRIPGDPCTKLGSPDMHAGCLADRAMNEQKAMFKAKHLQNVDITLFWLPVCGYPGCYIHFVAGTCNFEP